METTLGEGDGGESIYWCGWIHRDRSNFQATFLCSPWVGGGLGSGELGGGQVDAL
jgi:hypothetical protein